MKQIHNFSPQIDLTLAYMYGPELENYEILFKQNTEKGVTMIQSAKGILAFCPQGIGFSDL